MSVAKANSPGNPPKREKAVERKGRDVPDVRTPACMKAPEVPITGTSFRPITRENSRKAIKILGGLVRNRCRPLGHAHRTMGVHDPLCNASPTETSGTGDHIPQGVPKVVVSEPVSARVVEQGSDQASSTHPRLLQPLVPWGTGEWRPIIDLASLNVFVHCPSFTMVNPWGPTTGPVVNIPRPERSLLSYRDQRSRQTLPTLLSQRHRMVVHSAAMQAVNQSESDLPKYSNRY